MSTLSRVASVTSKPAMARARLAFLTHERNPMNGPILTARLIRMGEHLRRQGGRFDWMTVFHQCGSFGCVAGHLGAFFCRWVPLRLLMNFKSFNNHDSGLPTTDIEGLQSAFGLDNELSRTIFYGHVGLSRIAAGRGLYRQRYQHDNITAAEMLERLALWVAWENRWRRWFNSDGSKRNGVPRERTSMHVDELEPVLV